MKRILQSVALALAAILAVQPALATMTCAQSVCADGSSSANCCLPTSGVPMHGMSNNAAMLSMGASGQAPSLSSELIVISAPCCTVSSMTAPQLATPVKFGLSSVGVLTLVGVNTSVSAPVRAVQTNGDAVARTRTRYLMFQTFRI